MRLLETAVINSTPLEVLRERVDGEALAKLCIFFSLGYTQTVLESTIVGL